MIVNKDKIQYYNKRLQCRKCSSDRNTNKKILFNWRRSSHLFDDLNKKLQQGLLFWVISDSLKPISCTVSKAPTKKSG